MFFYRTRLTDSPICRIAIKKLRHWIHILKMLTVTFEMEVTSLILPKDKYILEVTMLLHVALILS